MFKANNKALFWCLYCKLSTYFTPCSSVSIVNIENVIAGYTIVNQNAGKYSITKKRLTKSQHFFTRYLEQSLLYLFSYMAVPSPETVSSDSYGTNVQRQEIIFLQSHNY